jgi:anti-sigma regulatory factor (Ser/Thr protein kinase)
MLASLTGGRLHLCVSSDDLPVALPDEAASGVVSLNAAALRAFRHRVIATCEAAHLSLDRTHDLVTAASEAAMNAVVHAGSGDGWACFDTMTGLVQVWVRDSGPGIPAESLHRATLERGFTTAGSLGHGFPMILETADRLWLLTGSTGTTVVLEQYPMRPEPEWLLQRDREAVAALA